ncbi:hypothetical protein PR048_032190 [Dryococelus australis]|uniref:Uncharacterized protein n=1 Tax=Dryococelus australis TaxID=614101 RepID=A0ABQ9G1I5_9NEOP|nr:hypothetical protein PR048_032190 [Dryococelus australis]
MNNDLSNKKKKKEEAIGRTCKRSSVGDYAPRYCAESLECGTTWHEEWGLGLYVALCACAWEDLPESTQGAPGYESPGHLGTKTKWSKTMRISRKSSAPLTSTPGGMFPPRLLAVHQGDPGSIPDRGHRILACGNRAGRCRWSEGLLGDLPLPPPPSFRRRSILTSTTLIGSQDRANSEKTRRATASSGTIPTCENPGVTPPDIEPVSARRRSERDSQRSRKKKEGNDSRRGLEIVVLWIYRVWRSARGYLRSGGPVLTHRPCEKNSAPQWKDLLVAAKDTVAERLVYSPPTKAVRVQSPAGSLRIFACGNRAGRCRWSADFIGDLPFSPPFHSGAAPYSPYFTLIGSQDLDVKCCPDLSTHSLTAQVAVTIFKSDEVYETIISTSVPQNNILKVTEPPTWSDFPRLLPRSPGAIRSTLPRVSNAPSPLRARFHKCGMPRSRHASRIYATLSGSPDISLVERVIKAVHNKVWVDSDGDGKEWDSDSCKSLRDLPITGPQLGAWWHRRNAGMKERGKREISWKTRRPAASSGTIATLLDKVRTALQEAATRATHNWSHTRRRAYNEMSRLAAQTARRQSRATSQPCLCGPHDLIRTLQDHDGNTARFARRSDKALGVRVSVAPIAPSLLDLGRAATSERRDGEKREIQEETRRPAASSGTIPTCENTGATPPGIETRLRQRWEASSLTTRPPQPILIGDILHSPGAAVVQGLDSSLPTNANRGSFPGGVPFGFFACGNRAGRCRWSADFLGDLPFHPCLHSGNGYHFSANTHHMRGIDHIHIKYITYKKTPVSPNTFIHFPREMRRTGGSKQNDCLLLRKQSCWVTRSRVRFIASRPRSSSFVISVGLLEPGNVRQTHCRSKQQQMGEKILRGVKKTKEAIARITFTSSWRYRFTSPGSTANHAFERRRLMFRESRPVTPLFPHKLTPEFLRSDEPLDRYSGLNHTKPLDIRCLQRGSHRGLMTRTGFDSRWDRYRIFAYGNRAGRYYWSADFLLDLTFPPPLHAGAAAHSLRFTLVGSRDL